VELQKRFKKPKSQYQLSRWFRADVWGKILNTKKKLAPLFFAVYNPYQRRPANFILRIDITKPRRRIKPLKPYAMAMMEKRKLSAYYGLTISQLRHLAYRTRNTASSGFNNNFVLTLESMLFSLCWRTGLFRNTRSVKTYIRSGSIYVNKSQKSSPGFRCAPGDFIDFRNLSYSQFFFSLKRKYLRFRDKHFLFNFRLNSLYYLKYPNKNKLFYHAPIRHRYVFFTSRFRKK